MLPFPKAKYPENYKSVTGYSLFIITLEFVLR
jgi:hypothetical protein